MKRAIKNTAIFTGGMSVGFATCGVLMIRAGLKSEAFKKALADKIVTCIYGERATYTRPTKVSYRDYYQSRRTANDRTDLIFESKSEAEDTLSQAREIIDKYGCLTVADFFDLAEVESSFTDTKYGWKDISNAQIIRKESGYVLDLGKALLLDK